MRRILLLSFFILNAALAALDISGRILNEAERPLENAIVSTSRKAAVTDKNGVFFLREISAADSVTIHKIGYQDQVFAAEMLPARIILKQAAISIAGVSVFGKKTTFKLPDTTDKIVIKVEETSNYQNAAEILADRADLFLSGTALHGETQNVTVPGFQPRHTLVMLDGIPLNKSGEAFDIASLPAEIIQSIEIIKGSSGSGATGGIININTKKNKGRSSAAYNHTFGSFGLDKHALTFSRSAAHWSGYLFLSQSYSRNDFQYKGHTGWENPDSLRTREFNDKKIYDLNLNLMHSNQNVNADYKLIFQDYFKKLPGTILNPDFFKNSRQTGQTFRHFLTLAKPIHDYNLKADLFYSQEESSYDNTRLDSLYNTALYRALSTTKQSARSAKLYTQYMQQDFHFDWGIDYKHESFSYRDKLQAANSISGKFLENYGVFGKTALEKYDYPSRWKLRASARWERSNRFRDFTSWQIAPEYTYETLFDIILGGNVANGFSYPSFLSLYWKGDTQVSGNPDLKPEESLSWLVFGKLDFNQHFLKISYRQDKLKDMIVWFLEYNSKWKPQNIGRAEIKTWEMEAEIKPTSFLTLNGMYSFIDARNRSKNSDLSGKNIIYTPQHKLNLKAQIRVQDFLAVLSYNRTGEQFYTFDQQSAQQVLPAYDLVNASLNYEIRWKQFRFSAGIKANNIFDKMYEVYRYIPQPGFNWDVKAGVKWSL